MHRKTKQNKTFNYFCSPNRQMQNRTEVWKLILAGPFLRGFTFYPQKRWSLNNNTPMWKMVFAGKAKPIYLIRGFNNKGFLIMKICESRMSLTEMYAVAVFHFFSTWSINNMSFKPQSLNTSWGVSCHYLGAVECKLQQTSLVFRAAHCLQGLQMSLSYLLMRFLLYKHNFKCIFCLGFKVHHLALTRLDIG